LGKITKAIYPILPFRVKFEINAKKKKKFGTLNGKKSRVRFIFV
jgi:hypothetical protein